MDNLEYYLARTDEAYRIKKEIIAYCEQHIKDIEDVLGVGVSVTDFGMSFYIQNLYGMKIRISDHSVTNINRFDEIMHSLHDNQYQNESFLKSVERCYFPERFELIAKKVIYVEEAQYLYNSLQEWKDTRKGIITKAQKVITRKGDEKIRIWWQYELEKEYRVWSKK